MDPWDREVQNPFDSFFDFDRDGVLNPIEQGFELDFLERQMKEDELSYETDEDDLELDGLDLDDLEYMDEDERREALEEAGYDPDDFEDDF
jgi:hypothetical protein